MKFACVGNTGINADSPSAQPFAPLPPQEGWARGQGVDACRRTPSLRCAAALARQEQGACAASEAKDDDPGASWRAKVTADPSPSLIQPPQSASTPTAGVLHLNRSEQEQR